MESIRRTKIADLLKHPAVDTTVNVKGWVRSKRGNKNVNFIALNDGSSIKNVQVVVDVEKFDAELLKICREAEEQSADERGMHKCLFVLASRRLVIRRFFLSCVEYHNDRCEKYAPDEASRRLKGE